MVFAAIPAYGHLYPVMPLALACADVGHDVLVATGEPFLDRLPLPTTLNQPAGLGLGWAVAETRRRHPKLGGLDFAVAMFADATAGLVCETLLSEFVRLAPDLVVYEAMNVGAGIAASVLGVPAIPFSIGLTDIAATVIATAALGYHEALWTNRHRDIPTATSLLGPVLLDPTPPSLRAAAPSAPADAATTRRSIPVRPVGYSESHQVPDWLLDVPARSRVYLTLGTVSFGAVEVLRRALHDLDALDVDVLVAIGPEGDRAALGDVGPRVRVEDFVSQPDVLPRVDLVVHHGGTGTVLGALGAGLPQLLLPQGADQFVNVATVTAVGAGRGLTNEQQEPGSILTAVAAMLGQSAERSVARRLQAEIAQQPLPVDVLPELVAVAAGA